MLWLDAPSGLVAAVYLVAGWQILLDLPAYAEALDRGRAGPARRRRGAVLDRGDRVRPASGPNPWPAVFGYHEVFHALVVTAALSHWCSVFLLTG